MRNLKGNRARGGSFDSNLTFVQNLTEAVKASPSVTLVASLPESNIEVGGTAGQEALERLENTFRRVQAAAYPVLARESFEIVRRRLFDDVGDRASRDDVCGAFARLYETHRNDFPSRTWEPEYERRLAASYPIHPEIFDRLYEEWSVNERFQRTRGVLRLMAAAIHALWRTQDAGALIMPGSLPISEPAVRSDLVSYLGEEWNAVIDSDVDGGHSDPVRIDGENPRFGKNRAATRVARAILLGSSHWKNTKGLEVNEILLGVVEPGQSLSEYSDALSRLRDRLSFLYTTGAGCYWLAAQPNLRRVVVDRESRIADEDALVEIEARLAKTLRESREKGQFAAVHVSPADSGDVPDDSSARLVVLSPRTPHVRDEGKALGAAREIFERRGTAPRHCKNMLVFAAAGSDEVTSLIETAKRFLAWKGVSQDAKALNLDQTQRDEVQTELGKTEMDLDAWIDPAYQWLLVPEQQGTEPVNWRITKLTGNVLDSAGGPALRASNHLVKDELLLPKWSPAGLDLELQRFIWKDGREDIKVRELWDLFATYVYLPRLRDANTLLETVRDGTASRDYFGYATSKTPDGYAGLAFGQRTSNVFLDDLGVVVRPDVAAEAWARLETPVESATQMTATGIEEKQDGSGTTESKEEPPRRFYGRIRLSTQRVGGAAGQVSEEVLQHLAGLVGAEVDVELDISVRVPDGIPDRVVRTVSENARTLKFDSFGFEPD